MKKSWCCAGAIGAATFFAGSLFLMPAPAAQENVAPSSPVVWQTDWEAARQKAVRENKPLFVRFRCFKMPEGLAALDAQIEKPTPGSRLARLLQNGVVPVRVGSMKGVDLNTFRFDYDLQLAGVVLDGRDSQTLARWGTRDAQSATGRISVSGLEQTLVKACATYNARTPAVSNSPAGQPLPPRTIDTAYPAFAQSARNKEACWHCHYANDARVAEEKVAGTLRKSALFMYPLPETVGVTLDPASANRVALVAPASPAQKAGVRVGDTIVTTNGAPVYSSADFQAVLNRVPSSGRALTLGLERERVKRKALLKLAPGWRESEDISWRPSQGAVPPILGTWETPLTADERKAAKLPDDGLALRVSFVFAGEKWAASHGDLQVGDIIVGANGQSPNIQTARQFHTWHRLHNTVGKTARFTVLRGGKQIVVPGQCVDVSL